MASATTEVTFAREVRVVLIPDGETVPVTRIEYRLRRSVMQYIETNIKAAIAIEESI